LAADDVAADDVAADVTPDDVAGDVADVDDAPVSRGGVKPGGEAACRTKKDSTPRATMPSAIAIQAHLGAGGSPPAMSGKVRDERPFARRCQTRWPSWWRWCLAPQASQRS
jgi:hypothetical protein